MTTDKERYLLITGLRRSGTTLLANFLDAQQQAHIYRDFLHIARVRDNFAPRLRLTDKLCHEQREAIVSYVDKMNRKVGLAASPLRPGDFDTLLELYVGTLRLLAHPGLVTGHKTTQAHDVVQELLASVAELRVLYIYRDPRDVVASTLKRWPAESVIAICAEWVRAHDIMRACAADPAWASRILLLPFEQLVDQRPHTLRALSDFLGIPVMVPDELHDYGRSWEGNSSFDNDRTVISKEPVGRWRNLDPDVITVVEVMCGTRMSEAGYPLSCNLSTIDRLRVNASSLVYSINQSLRSRLRVIRARAARARAARRRTEVTP